MKILIVDDEQAICESIARNLKRIGFTVISEVKGKNALKVIKSEQPDIILLDLLLGDADGNKILTEVKEQYPGMIVIVITALKDEESQSRALSLGADDFLTKPFKAEELRKTIKGKIESVLIKKDKMEKPSILIVDDSDEYRQQIAKFITRYYQVDLSEVRDGEMAVKAIKSKRFDLIVLDIKMPGQDGLEVLKEIKDIISLSRVIVLSGWADKQVVLNVLNLGVYAYFSKSEPNIFDELKEKIESIFITEGKLIKQIA